jgi:transcriptional regulator of acetoin/glycerol metabolism
VSVRSPLSASPSDAAVAEAEALRELLARHECNVARVARLLGVTRMTVYNRMRRRGVLRFKDARASRRRRPGQGES